MITQLWGLSKRTLRQKREPCRFPNIWNLLNSLQNLEVAQKREPCGSFCLVVDQFVFAVPAVEFADFFANLFRRMLSCELSHRFEVYLTACGAHVKQELFCEGTILDIGQDLLHCFLGIFGNDLRTVMYRRIQQCWK